MKQKQFSQKAAKQVIEDQEECGIDIITDGEVRRENYIHYHCRHLEGVDFETLTEKVGGTGNYKCWLPTITNKVKAKEEFLVKEWKNNQALTSTPYKSNHTNFNDYYGYDSQYLLQGR